MILANNLYIRELTLEDAPHLAKWLSDPEVLEFYEGRDQPHDLALVKKVFYSKEDGLTPNIILYNEKPIGYVQYYPVDTKDKTFYGYGADSNVYGMDQFIGEPSYWGRGIGQHLVNEVVRYLFTEKDADIVVMDPQVRNKRALRCYEKCGFRIVKTLPEQELHEGKMEDCYLIEKKKNLIEQKPI
jgi:aminoglycoside 6'-N-acetyltransferase